MYIKFVIIWFLALNIYRRKLLRDDNRINFIKSVRSEIGKRGWFDFDARPPKIDGSIEAKTTLFASSEPPGGRSTWILKLLADKLVELKAIDSISTMGVQRILKKGNQALAEYSMVHR
jgi:hypothetical protein